MKRRILAAMMAVLVTVGACSGCGRDQDDYTKGYEAEEAGRYEEALKYLEKAAKDGDEQAQNIVEIVSGYLNAEEAFQAGDAVATEAFLDEIPDNYKYFTIAEDIDDLKRKIRGKAIEDEDETVEEEKKPAKQEEDQEDQDEKKQTEGKDEKDKENAKDEVPPEQAQKWEENDRNLQEARKMIQEGRLDAASDYLQDVDEGSLTKEQQKQLEQEKKALEAEKKETASQSNRAMSPEQAQKYLQAAYPELVGDIGEALIAQKDSNGNTYYAITVQLNEEICTLHIMSDGTVKKVS